MSTSSTLLSPLFAPLAWALVHFLWQGTLVALLLAGLLALAPTSAPRRRYGMALGALIILAALPALTAWRLAPPATPLVASASAPAEADASSTASIAAPPPHATAAFFTARPGSLGLGAWLARISRALRPSLPWVIAIWLAGVALLSCVHLLGWLRLARVRHRDFGAVNAELAATAARLAARLGLRRPVRVVESAALLVPAVVGWLRPVILVPVSALSALPVTELDSILAHELAHVRRHDYLINLFQAVIEIVLFYHPAVWWVSRQVRIERELCCDDLAVAVCGDAFGYARALAHLEGSRAQAPWLATAATSGGRGTLLGRIRRLVAARTGRTPSRNWLAGTLCLLAVVALLGAAGLANAAQTWGTDVVVDDAPTAAAAAARLSSATIAPANVIPVRAAGISASAATDSGAEEPAASVGSRHASFVASTTTEGGGGESGDFSGTWQAKQHADGRVWLEIRHESRHGFSENSFDINADELTGFGRGAGFELRREAGTLRFSGAVTDGSGHGTYTFAPNPAFTSSMAGLGYQLDEPQMYEAAVLNVTTAFVRDIKAAGQRDVSFSRLVEFRIHGVSAGFIKELGDLGYRDLSAERLVEFRIHGVSPEYVRDLDAQGYRGVAAERLVEFRIHGVSPDYVASLAKAGYRDVSAERLVAFRIHGVNPEELRDFAQLGYTDLPADRLVEFRIHGVSPAYVRSIADTGYKNVDAETLIRMRIHGVDADFIRDMQANGHRGASADEMVTLRIHGGRSRHDETNRR